MAIFAGFATPAQARVLAHARLGGALYFRRPASAGRLAGVAAEPVPRGHGYQQPHRSHMDTHLVISAIGHNRPGLIDELSRAILDCGCNIGDSRMAVLGSELAIMMALSGHWNAIAKLEGQLAKLEESLDIRIISKRSDPRAGTENLIPYGIEVVSIDHPGIVYEVANFFSRRGINVEDLYTSCYPAPHTGASMFALHMTIGIPSDAAIASVRGDFMDFCDDLNLDAMMAPVK